MSAPKSFELFPTLPYELQVMVWKEAIANEHGNRVVPLLEATKRVVLTADVIRALPKFFGLCKTACDAVDDVYDCRLMVAHNNTTRIVRLSTALEIFLVGGWQFSLGVNAHNGNFNHSLSALSPTLLAKVASVMEHQVDLGDLVYHPVPHFDRAIYSSAKLCYIRVDCDRPTTQDLARLLGGGPYSAADVLSHYTNPALYEERVLGEDTTGDESDENTE
ncbi:hypothetical protein PGQ11_006216 [Apiospora arundinis]|uniref:2EXR domain-containing protein n=1 Tax=Apiospora arundinis TaxID=335852 RepID=A0ABR2IT06_9PEZI